MEVLDALRRPRPEFGDRTKLDRISRARLRTGRLEPLTDPVIAEGTLLSRTRGGVDIDGTEGTGGDTVPAAITDNGLDHERTALGPDARTGRADRATTRPVA